MWDDDDDDDGDVGSGSAARMALEIYYPRKAMRCDSDARTEKRVALFCRTLFLYHFFTHTLFCIHSISIHSVLVLC